MDDINMANMFRELSPGGLLADDQGGAEENNVTIKVLRLSVCTVGVIGNAMVIFVILVLKEYKKTLTHWYVLQLAFADSLFLLTLPFKVAEDDYGKWTFSGGMCKAKEAILFLNYYSSILFLMVMSIDRYIAVCHGLSQRLRKFREKRSAYIITAIVWGVSLLLCAPILIYSDKSGIDPHCKCTFAFPTNFTAEEGSGLSQNEENCKKIDFLTVEDYSEEDYQLGSGEDNQFGSEIYAGDWMTKFFNISASDPVYKHGCSYIRHGAGWSAFVSFNFIVMFVIPLLMMSVCYCLIAFRLKQSRIRRSSVTNESAITVSTATRTSGKTERKRTKSAASVKAERNRLRVTVTCLILVVLFLICWLPFHAVHLAKMNGISGSATFCANLSSVSTVIAYLNSALNPYIYNFIGTKFGKRLRSAAKSVRTSVKKRTPSLSSARGTVRYQPRKQSATGISTNSATVMTKIYRRKSEVELSSHREDETQGRETLLET